MSPRLAFLLLLAGCARPGLLENPAKEAAARQEELRVRLAALEEELKVRLAAFAEEAARGTAELLRLRRQLEALGATLAQSLAPLALGLESLRAAAAASRPADPALGRLEESVAGLHGAHSGLARALSSQPAWVAALERRLGTLALGQEEIARGLAGLYELHAAAAREREDLRRRFEARLAALALELQPPPATAPAAVEEPWRPHPGPPLWPWAVTLGILVLAGLLLRWRRVPRLRAPDLPAAPPPPQAAAAPPPGPWLHPPAPDAPPRRILVELAAAAEAERERLAAAALRLLGGDPRVLVDPAPEAMPDPAGGKLRVFFWLPGFLAEAEGERLVRRLMALAPARP